ncbi:MAG: multiheme c-type cytochrome [Planctomycetaceae bacterium]
MSISKGTWRLTAAMIVLCAGLWIILHSAFDSGASYQQSGGLGNAPVTYRVAPDDWAQLVTTGGPGTPPWVLLPPDFSEEDFVSAVKAENRGFLAPTTCAECHREKFETFKSTTHALTSRLPGETSILGDFSAPANILTTASPDVFFEMEKTADSYLQKATIRDESHRRSYSDTFSFDLILGSGNHGQSYLYWNRDRLYQMHVSYLSESQSWVNSPGPYFDGTIDYARPVPPRCLDCHATWIAFDPKEVNRFDRSTLIPGVTCVRCHGPGHEHIAIHRQHPELKEGKRIIHPGKLSVQRANELCAQCHSSGEQIGAPFGYRPGEPLATWMEIDLSAEAENNADPHSANQLARLMQSRCYTESDGLSCVRCHDPHRSQLGQLRTYAAKCRDCHQPADCRECATNGARFEDHCVDCHMPAKRDAQVRMQTSEGKMEALLRDHRIAVWPDTSAHVKSQLRNDTGSPHQEPPTSGELPQ